MVAGPTLLIFDATFAVNVVRRGGRAARKDIDSGAPKLRAAHVDDGAGLGVDRSRPVAINPREDATGPDCAHVERAAIECHGRIAGPQHT